MRQSILQKIKQSRAFFFALVAVAIVWIVSEMSEQKKFRESYTIAYDNLDTAKYAIIHKDSTITIDISSNGFHALNRWKAKKDISDSKYSAIHFDLSKIIEQHKNDSTFSITLQTKEYTELIKSQLDMQGVSDISLVSEQINLQVALREHKALVPDISRVTFNFDKMAGLNGEPQIKPDSVVIYGSRESLSKIESIAAKEQVINNIKESKSYRISLQDDWKKYPDIRLSSNEISVFVPVEIFIEKSITLPVTLTDKDGNAQWNLYPANVTAQVLVPKSKAETIDLSKCVITASAKDCSDNLLTPMLSKFPSCVRLKSLSPEKIQYIIIEQ